MNYWFLRRLRFDKHLSGLVKEREGRITWPNSWLSQNVINTQKLDCERMGHHPLLSQGTVAESWVRSGTCRTKTSNHLRCQHCRIILFQQGKLKILVMLLIPWWLGHTKNEGHLKERHWNCLICMTFLARCFSVSLRISAGQVYRLHSHHPIPLSKPASFNSVSCVQRSPSLPPLPAANTHPGLHWPQSCLPSSSLACWLSSATPTSM